MNERKRKQLEKAGWVETSVKDFLGLTDDDERAIALMQIVERVGARTVYGPGIRCKDCGLLREIGDIARGALDEETLEFVERARAE